MKIIIIGLFITNLAIAQNSLNTSGGQATGVSGNVSYSVGQIMYTDFESASGKVSQGIQQPIEIFLLSNTGFGASNAILLYPNPATNELFITINELLGDLKYYVNDLNGKKVMNGNITQLQAKIDIENFSPGIYLLTIFSEKSLAQKTFKIIKNN